MPEHTRTIPREVPDGTAEGGRKRPREGMDAGYIRRRPRGKRDGDFGNPDGPEPLAIMNASQRSSWRGETPITGGATTPAGNVIPTVYCFRSLHLLLRTN